MRALNTEIWKTTLPENAPFQVETILKLPETVLQFGTGVLLRGLPDYFIDLANKAGTFKGRVVMVKSTLRGDVSDFKAQQCLYTHIIRGIADGKLVEETIINASISRVLSAQQEWEQVIECAESPDMQLIVSNTTEAGLRYEAENILTGVPQSFPAKLLAWLYHRFMHFKGDPDRGMVIIPTELIPRNGELLKQLLLDLSVCNSLSKDFQSWLERSNHFCNSLVDRIVPGKPPPAEQEALEQQWGYRDPLMIVSEPYALWAIAVQEEPVQKKIGFKGVHKGVILTADISDFAELKLRLLNGSHTFSCALAFLAGFRTVKEAMQDERFFSFQKTLLLEELVPSVAHGSITLEKARDFALNTLERFQNPFIEHPWINISLQYSSKMKIRNLPTLHRSASVFGSVPTCMVLGFAAYILFMRSKKDREGNYSGVSSIGHYPVNDDQASIFSELWERHGEQHIAASVIGNEGLWGTDLSTLPGFIQDVNSKLQFLQEQGAMNALALLKKGKMSPKS